MADADAKPPPKSDPDVDPIAAISPSSPGGLDAAAIEDQLAGLAVADELPDPSGWDDGPVVGTVGGDDTSGDKLPAPATATVAVADSRPRFPRRAGEPDCTYYLKFGSCRFGMKCKFNHPARKKKNRVKGSGSSGSWSNSSSNKASSPDDEQTPKEEYEDLVPHISAEVDCLGTMEPKELKIAEEPEKGINLNKFDEIDQKVAKEKRKETVSEGNAQEECKDPGFSKSTNPELVSEVGPPQIYIYYSHMHGPGQARKSLFLTQNIKQYYSTPGGCKFGKSCKYLHREGKERKTEAEKAELNFLGLPLRPGGKDCPYYMRTGSCKFATNCRFHHPDPTNVASKDLVLEHENGDTPQQNVQGSSQMNVSIWPAHQRTLNEQHAPFLAPAPSYSAGMIPPQGMVPPQGMYPSPEWTGYHQVPLNPYYPPGIPFHHFPAPPVNHPMYKASDVPGHQQLSSDEYPERPGQPECQHFVKSGFCKFRMKCKYHHPRSLMPPPPAGALSPLGLPLKPDQPVCTYYGRYGVCKFGPACMYNHPFNFGHPVPAAGPPISGQYLTPGNYTV